VIDHATLALTTASGKAEVQTTVSSTDPDGDRVTYEYRWFKNGTLIAGAAGPSLPASDFARGDKVSAEVVASDGQGKSAPVRADPVGLENHPPQFTSQPYAPGAKDDAFHYRAIATDADGDSLRYELVQGPSGMTVDPYGNVSWTLPPRESRRGDQPVVIRASDPAGGQATQEFTIHLDAPPASH
jgi:hypothetical protein